MRCCFFLKKTPVLMKKAIIFAWLVEFCMTNFFSSPNFGVVGKEKLISRDFPRTAGQGASILPFLASNYRRLLLRMLVSSPNSFLFLPSLTPLMTVIDGWWCLAWLIHSPASLHIDTIRMCFSKKNV